MHGATAPPEVRQLTEAEPQPRPGSDWDLAWLEAVLWAILDSTSEGILIVGLERVYYFNRRFAELWRIPADLYATSDESQLRRYALDQVEDPDGFVAGIEELARTRVEVRDTLRLKDGRVYERCARPLVQDGALTGHVLSFRDVTEEQGTEETLRQSEQRFRLLAENAQDAIFRYRLTEPGGLEYISPAMEAISGYTAEECVADPGLLLTIVHPDDRETFTAMLDRRVTDPVELRGVRKDGSVVWTERRSTFVDDDAGQLVAIEGIIRDITDRKRMEEALQWVREELEGKVEHQMRLRNPYGLTFREFTVLHLVAAGKTDKEIARELGISPLTVHKHVSSILARMNASSRTEAGVRALREGLVG